MEVTLLEPGTAPFSFIYDGRISGDFLSDWDFTTTKEPLDETRIQQILTYTDHKTGLEVRCEVTTFSDHPAVEWVLKLKNSGEYDTPIISNIQAIDTTLTDEPSECKLHYASGVREGVAAGADDFRPKTQLLPPNSSFDVSSLHGRSSWGESLPFSMLRCRKKELC
jgi:alpha-galactosidase